MLAVAVLDPTEIKQTHLPRLPPALPPPFRRLLRACRLAANDLGISRRQESPPRVQKLVFLPRPTWAQRSPHLSAQSGLWWGARARSRRRDGAPGPVFTAICANGPVYVAQDSSVKRGRRRTTQLSGAAGAESVWLPAASISLGTGERGVRIWGWEFGGRGGTESEECAHEGRHFSEKKKKKKALTRYIHQSWSRGIIVEWLIGCRSL